MQVEYHVLPPDVNEEGIDPMSPRQMLDIMRALQSRGLRVFHSEPNYWCVHGHLISHPHGHNLGEHYGDPALHS